MIRVEEILPLNHGQRPESIPPEARERQIAERNAVNTLLWYTRTFGEVPGRVLADEGRP